MRNEMLSETRQQVLLIHCMNGFVIMARKYKFPHKTFYETKLFQQYFHFKYSNIPHAFYCM